MLATASSTLHAPLASSRSATSGPAPARAAVKIYQRRLEDLDFRGYNPFGMVNMMQDRIYLKPKPEELRRHL
ncbi:MAG: hypothetical protein ACHP93_06810, partial [Solirubrobacterales bacterium]